MNQHLQQLVDVFAANVTMQNAATTASIGNRHARKYIAAFDELRQFGDEGREALSTLLHHPSVDVRAMAACFLLRYKTKEALVVLREAAKEPGLVGFGANQCIKGWEEGTWQLDSPEEVPAAEAVWRSKMRASVRPDVKAILEGIPDRVPYGEVAEPNRLDDRVAVANIHYDNIIGVSDGCLEWCPNNEPPTEAERLAWWWVVRPDLGAAIAAEAEDVLIEVIGNYILEAAPVQV